MVLIAFIFLLGLCVGSFLNVLIYRLPHRLPITGRSFCPKCKKKISWYDNLPLVSFVLLRGKCRFCHSPISLRYPLVELITGILSVFTFFYFYPNFFLIAYLFIVIWSLIVIAAVDLEHQIILDQIVFPVALTSFGYQLSFSFQTAFINVGVGFLAALFFALLVLATRGKGMGIGDVKLAGFMGLILGYEKVIVALYLAFLTGAASAVILILQGKKRFGQHIPFGPFLAASSLVTLFWGDKILRWFLARFF